MFTASSVVWEFAIRSHESGNMTLPPWKSAPTLERFPRSNFGDLALHRSLGVVLAALSLTVAHAAPIDGEPPAARGALSLRDDFEDGKLAAFWLPGNYGTGSHMSGAVVLTAEHAHRGRKSCRITVREGDVEALGDDGKKVERAELDSGHLPLLGRDVYYGFAFLLPKDFPVVDNRLVIGSIKQSDVEGSPLLGQRFQAGRHMLSIRPPGASGSGRKYPLPAIKLGAWVEMVYRVRYSEDQNGLIELWMDGTKVVTYKGPTASPKGANRFYHKVGLYRDRWKAPMTMYLDDYAVGESFNAVDPSLGRQK
jgi:hypothetical protein